MPVKRKIPFYAVLLSLLSGCILLVTATCGAQEDLVNARLCYSEYFNPVGINYNDAVARFGDNDASTACYISQITSTPLPSLRNVFVDCSRDWFRVMVHFGIDPTVLFLPVPSTYNVGPPYGNAYGYWRKHAANPGYRIVLSSNDVVNLANLNIIHRYCNTPVVDIMNYRAKNRSFHWIAGTEYKKQGKGHYKTGTGNSSGKGNNWNNGNNGNDWNNGNQGNNKGNKNQGQGHGKPKKK